MARRFALPLMIWLGLLFNVSGANAKKTRRSSKARPTPSRVTAAKADAKKTKTAKKRRVRNRATKRTRRRVKRDMWPPMNLAHVNTRERLKVRLYDRRGRTIKASVRRIWRLMRCHHTGRRRPIHWRLVSHLYKISRHYKGRTLRIYSGYRSSRISYLGRRSKHTVGRAVDFAVDGVSTRSLRDYLRRTFKSCGIGYYPNTRFVHLDIRKKPAFWVDYSGKGEDPRYANPYEVLRKERLVARGLVAKKQQAPAEPKASAGEPEPGAGAGKPAPAARPSVSAKAASPAQPAPASQPATVEGPPPVGPAPQHQAEKRPPAAPPKARKSPVSNVRGAP